MGSGILFLLAGGLYSMVFINIWLLPGVLQLLAATACSAMMRRLTHVAAAIFVPYRKRDATSMMWWALYLYWQDSPRAQGCCCYVFAMWSSDRFAGGAGLASAWLACSM